MNKAHPQDITLKTLTHYAENPDGFWQGTKDHDVTQNIHALLSNIQKPGPFKILDFGCGPGRDLKTFHDLGHDAYGLDGLADFCQMAAAYSGRKVYHQNFINLNLPASFFDGVFANASLFHVPKDHLTNVLETLHTALADNGILFSSNPRGSGEDLNGSRYANFMEKDNYQNIVEAAGFQLLEHYYRPPGQPVETCPWLACVFIKKS